jgi:hypothetical protein
VVGIETVAHSTDGEIVAHRAVCTKATEVFSSGDSDISGGHQSVFGDEN